LRIGTRASKLARLQTDIVVGQLKSLFPNERIEIVPVTTGGDKVVDKPIAELGFRGVFVKELEDALLRNEVDLVVHSLKDVPTEMPEGLAIVAVLEREDPRDVLISRDGLTLDQMPKGSKIATSSRRRAAQLREHHNFDFIDIRGNIETRLRKLDEGYCDATLLAHAGLLRLGLAQRVTHVFNPLDLTPAAGQGALAVECRADDEDVVRIVSTIDQESVRKEIECERAFLSHLGGGCSVPIGVLARAEGNNLSLTGCIAALDGAPVYRHTISGPVDKHFELAERLITYFLDRGAGKVLEQLRLSVPNKISPP